MTTVFESTIPNQLPVTGAPAPVRTHVTAVPSWTIHVAENPEFDAWHAGQAAVDEHGPALEKLSE